MQSHQDLVIVLRTTPYEDRHQIVTGLSENFGKISAIAMNSVQSRRFGGSLALFTAGNWSWSQKQGSDLVRLEHIEVRKSFAQLAQDFERFTMAGIIAETALRLATDGPTSGSELFKILSNGLISIEEMSEPDPRILTSFFMKAFQCSGSQPAFSSCEKCNSPIHEFQLTVRLFPESGGWRCPKCAAVGGFEMDAQVIADASMSLHIPIRQSVRHFSAPIQNHRDMLPFWEHFMGFHLPGADSKPLKSLRLIQPI